MAMLITSSSQASEGSTSRQTAYEAARLLQREEYEVLESIYPECISTYISEGSLKLEVPIEFDEPQTICFVEDGSVAASSSEPLSITLSSLPPLLINVILPPSYPLTMPPELVSIRATHSWLLNITRLQAILNEMWQPGEGVLYNWIEYLRTGEFLPAMNMVASDGTIQITHPVPRLLAPVLASFELLRNSKQFAQNSYSCSVCLTDYKGSKCLQLSCNHIFCRGCLEDFWKLCIAEGEVGRVGCPDPACVKAGSEAVEEEVARVVTETELQRWRWLREKRNIEKDPTIVHCPMTFCQKPVPKPSEIVDSDSGWDRLRSCPSCLFSFCSFCKRTWHGPLTPCPIAYSEKLVLEYLATPEDSAERLVIERRFGKTNVLKLVKTFQEDMANNQWIKSSTMACPGCQINVEKSLGCNHMTCSKCRQHFCYRCGEKLPPDNPYKHFSTPGLACYYKLFDFQSEEDGEWQPIEGMDLW